MQHSITRWSSYVKWILTLSILLLIGGAAMNHFSGRKGRILLEKGKVNHLVLKNEGQDTLSEETDLGFIMTLDSLRIAPFIPAFEFRINKMTEEPDDGSGMGPVRQTTVVRQYPMEMMKITRIEKSDFHFRAKAFFPDFEFKYTYTTQRDTIQPHAPGMVLQLHTTDGPAIVTLRKDQPKRHFLGDIVGLGASFTFFWELAAEDVMQAIEPEDTAALKILFSGADQKLYHVKHNSVSTSTFKENQFNPIPGHDSLGFTVLFSVPDVDQLKAVPSTQSEKPVNPVVSVEVWKKGGPAQEVFLYPKMTGRSGGEFEVPGSNYTLTMEIDQELAVRHCTCYMAISKGEGATSTSLRMQGPKGESWKGYQFRPEACTDRGSQRASIAIDYRPGSGLLTGGWILAGVSFILLVWFAFRDQGEKAGHPTSGNEKDQPLA